MKLKQQVLKETAAKLVACYPNRSEFVAVIDLSRLSVSPDLPKDCPYFGSHFEHFVWSINNLGHNSDSVIELNKPEHHGLLVLES